MKPVLSASIVLSLLPLLLSAQEAFPKTKATGDPRDFVVIAEVSQIADSTAFAELRRYPDGNPRNVILIPARRLTGPQIANALMFLTDMRNTEGKEHKEVITAFQHRSIKMSDLSTGMARVAADYREKLRYSPLVRIRDVREPAHSVIVYLSEPKESTKKGK